ncbi:Aldehyde/histidinol dehydrogenase [Aspergillus spectabilis]
MDIRTATDGGIPISGKADLYKNQSMLVRLILVLLLPHPSMRIMVVFNLFTTSDTPSSLSLNNNWVQGHGDPLPYYTSSHYGSGIDIPPLHAASVDEVDETVSDAQAALEGEWSRTSGGERAALLHRLANLITQHANEIAYYESLCSGVPLSFATMSIPLVVQVFLYYAGWADKYKGDYFPPDDGYYKIVEHEPLGICVGITAWNTSLHFLAWNLRPP